MSEYVFCTSFPHAPGVIHIRTSRYDPREDTLEAKMRRREIGKYTLEWTLPVVNAALSEAALRKALRAHRARADKTGYDCGAMAARGEAVKLTTLRPEKIRKKAGLLRRLMRAA